MKPAGLVALLAGTLFATASENPPSPLPVRHETAVDRLGIAFAPTVNPGAPAPAAAPVQDLDLSALFVLPKLTVRESRIDLEAHRMLTPKGRLAEAKQRELSPLYRVTFGPLAFAAAAYFDPLVIVSALGGWARPNEAEAIVLYEQDERLRRLHEADSLIDLLKASDPTACRELRGAMRQSFQLRSPNTGEH